VATAWREADRLENGLRNFYRDLREDNRYTDAFKSETAWKRFEQDAPRIRAGREKVKNMLTDRIESWMRMSIPTPDGENLVSTDDTKILLQQNELTRVVRKVDRLVSNARGPMKPNPTQILKAEYESALRKGGPRGGATVRAVIDAADEYEIPVETIVADSRRERHQRLVDLAEDGHNMLQVLATTVTEPPFPHPRRAEISSFASRKASTAGVRGEAGPQDNPAATHEPEPDDEGGSVTIIGGRPSKQKSHIERDTINVKSGTKENSPKSSKGKKGGSKE